MNEVKIVWSDTRIRNIKALAEVLSVCSNDNRQKFEEEIILAAFKKWGSDFGNHICGRFSVVIEDTAKKKIYLIRDHFGLAPLYYGVLSGSLYSSPCIRNLTEQNSFPKDLNEKALVTYFIYGYPLGPETFYKGIKKVVPGHCLVWGIEEKQFISDIRWFVPDFTTNYSLSETDWLSALEDVFNTIMQEENADIKNHSAGCLLSSGVDSSYLLAASDIRSAFSIGYPDFPFSETEKAGETAAFLNRNFTESICSVEEFIEEYKVYVRSVDQPIVNPTVPVIGSLCSKISKTSELLYSGEGADEFFVGYYSSTVAEFLSLTKKPYFGFGKSVSYENVQKLMRTDCSWIKESIPDEIYRDTEQSGAFSAAMWTDIHLYYEGDTCAYVSYIMKKFGIDIRLPFADPRIFEITSKIPAEYLLHGMDSTNNSPAFGKYIFRKLAAGKLPYEVAFRAKQAFPAPIRSWIRHPELQKIFNEMIFSKTADMFFNTDYLKNVWESYLLGDNSHWRMLYAVCTFLCWYESSVMTHL